MDAKSELQKAAGKVNIDESVANLIADQLEEQGLTIIKKEDVPNPSGDQKPAAQLKVQPAKGDTK